VACNTISVTSLETLRSAFPSIPIVGTVPAIKLAAKVSKNKRIGLLATNATISAMGEVENGVSLTLYFDALGDSPWFFKVFGLDELPQESSEE
jgi:glutamate racemase